MVGDLPEPFRLEVDAAFDRLRVLADQTRGSSTHHRLLLLKMVLELIRRLLAHGDYVADRLGFEAGPAEPH